MNRCQSVVVALASGLVSAVLMAAGTGTLKVQIVDSEGAAMGGAQVIVRPDGAGRQQSGRATQEMTSADQAGRLTRAVEPGFYDVCVMADAFVPVCQKVRVGAEDTKNIKVHMKIDPNVIREIGDSFPMKGRPAN